MTPRPAQAADETQLVIGVNTCRGGIAADGSALRWQALTGYLRGRQPRVLMLQEVRGVTEEGTPGHLEATAGTLGMAVVTAGPRSPGAPIGEGHHTAILVRPAEGLAVIQAGPAPAYPWDALPWAEALVQLPGLPVPVWFYSVHLPPSRHTGRMLHAEKLAAVIAARAEHGQPAFVVGDFNCLADEYTQEQLLAMPRRVRPSRTEVLPDSSLAPKPGVHRELAAAGLTDIAAALPPARRTPAALTPSGTAGGRVDYGFAHSPLAGAVEHCDQVRIREATDHDFLEFTVRIPAAAAALLRADW